MSLLVFKHPLVLQKQKKGKYANTTAPSKRMYALYVDGENKPCTHPCTAPYELMCPFNTHTARISLAHNHGTAPSELMCPSNAQTAIRNRAHTHVPFKQRRREEALHARMCPVKTDGEETTRKHLNSCALYTQTARRNLAHTTHH